MSYAAILENRNAKQLIPEENKNQPIANKNIKPSELTMTKLQVNDEGKPRPIIARFWSSTLRNDLYFNKKLCKGKPISITENLTKRRALLKTETKQKYGAKNVWTKEGRIYAKEEASGNIKLILA